MIDVKAVKKQARFCRDLMERLNNEIEKGYSDDFGMEKHTVKQHDIVRLRRELMVLSNLLDPWRR